MTSAPVQLLIAVLLLTVLTLSVAVVATTVRHSSCKANSRALLQRLLPSLRPQLHYRWDLKSGRVVRDITLRERLGLGATICASGWQEWAALVIPADRSAYENAMSAVEAGASSGYLLQYSVTASDGRVLSLVDQGVATAVRPDGRARVISGRVGILVDHDQEAGREYPHGGVAVRTGAPVKALASVNGDDRRLRTGVERGRTLPDPVSALPVVAPDTIEVQQVLFGRAGGVLFSSAEIAAFFVEDVETTQNLGSRVLHAATAVDAVHLDELWQQAERRGLARRRVRLSTHAGSTRLLDLTLVSVNSEFARSEMLLEARNVLASEDDEGRSEGLRLEMLSRYTRRYAHDVRSPLGTVRNLTELIRGASEDQAGRERHAMLIDRAVDDIAAATRDLGRFADWNKDSLDTCDLATVLEAVVSEFGAEYGIHRSSLIIPNDARAIAIPDPALRVVARSLLREVYEATFGEGGVHVLATRVDDFVVIRVESDDALSYARREASTASVASSDPQVGTAAVTNDSGRRVRIASEVLGMFGATLAVSRTPTGGTLFEVRCPASATVS